MYAINLRYNDLKLLHGKQGIPNLANWKSWKADQIRTFFLYLIVPLLAGFLPSQYFNTLCDFNKSLFLMFKPTITKDELEELETLLKSVHFSVSNKKVWHRSLCSLNMHDMIHLPLQVKLTGALCNSSGFICEAAVGEARKCKFKF